MRKRFCFFAAAVVIVSFTAVGCGSDRGRVSNGQVLAKINNYELKSGDFKDEADIVFSNKYLPGGETKAKDVLLEDIIMKKILLQEAQKEDFDKNAAFMKEIERYWEQTLLKLLVKKKTAEFSRNITVSDAEIRAEYDRMSKEQAFNISFSEAAPEIKKDIIDRKVQTDFDEWMKGLRGSASVEIYKDVLKNVKIFK